MALPADATNIIDLNEVVDSFAWKNYDEAAKSERRLRNLRKKHNKNNFIDIRIDWSRVHFDPQQKDWAIAADAQKEKLSSAQQGQGDKNVNASTPPKPGVATASKSSGSPTAWVNSKASNTLLPDTGRPGVNVLFQTTFTNNSNNNQEYNLKVEKTTTSVCETFVESTFTRGFQFELTLKTPCEVLEANAGYSREYSITKSQGETLEKSVTWSVESKIEVEKQSVAEAYLVVDESTYKGDFEVIYEVYGSVVITFHDMRKPDAPQIFFTNCGIVKIVKEFLKEERSKPGKSKAYAFVEVPGVDKIISYASQTDASGNTSTAGTNDGQEAPKKSPVRRKQEKVTIKNRGTSNFRYGIKQEVLVNQMSLAEFKKLHPDM